MVPKCDSSGSVEIVKDSRLLHREHEDNTHDEEAKSMNPIVITTRVSLATIFVPVADLAKSLCTF